MLIILTQFSLRLLYFLINDILVEGIIDIFLWTSFLLNLHTCLNKVLVLLNDIYLHFQVVFLILWSINDMLTLYLHWRILFVNLILSLFHFNFSNILTDWAFIWFNLWILKNFIISWTCVDTIIDWLLRVLSLDLYKRIDITDDLLVLWVLIDFHGVHIQIFIIG